MNLQYKLYWNTFLPVLSQSFRFVISIIVARLLLPSDFGIISISMIAITFANILTNFGFNQAIIQKKIKDNQLINSIFTLDLLISTFLFIIFLSFAKSFAFFFKIQEAEYAIRVLSLIFIITSFQGIANALLSRDLRFEIISTINLFHTIFSALLTLILAYAGYRYWSLIYGQIIPLAIMTLILCIYSKWQPSICYKNYLMKSIYDFGIWNFLKAQLQYFSQNIDKIVIGKTLGAHDLGLYDKSMSISIMPLDAITMNINSVLFASYSKNKTDLQILRKQFLKSLALISLINTPIYLGLIAVSPHFVLIILGDKWSEMIIPFQIILFSSIFKSFAGVISSLNVSMGNYRLHTVNLLFSTIIFVSLIVILFKYKLIGISIAYLLYCIATPYLTINLARSKLELTWKDILSGVKTGILGASFMFSLVIILMRVYYSDIILINMIILIIFGCLFYLIYIYFDDSEYSNEIKEKLKYDLIKIFKILAK